MKNLNKKQINEMENMLNNIIISNINYDIKNKRYGISFKNYKKRLIDRVAETIEAYRLHGFKEAKYYGEMMEKVRQGSLYGNYDLVNIWNDSNINLMNKIKENIEIKRNKRKK